MCWGTRVHGPLPPPPAAGCHVVTCVLTVDNWYFWVPFSTNSVFKTRHRRLKALSYFIVRHILILPNTSQNHCRIWKTPIRWPFLPFHFFCVVVSIATPCRVSQFTLRGPPFYWHATHPNRSLNFRILSVHAKKNLITSSQSSVYDSPLSIALPFSLHFIICRIFGRPETTTFAAISYGGKTRLHL